MSCYLNKSCLYSQVGYNITGWLEKNKDPLNDTVVDQFKKGNNKLVVEIFADHPGQSGGGAAEKGMQVFLFVDQRGQRLQIDLSISRHHIFKTIGHLSDFLLLQPFNNFTKKILV